MLSGVIPFRKHPTAEPAIISPRGTLLRLEKSAPVSAIVIGASTGGPQAMQTIFTKLPASFAAPIVCVQHIGDDFLDGLIDWLSSKCKLKFRSAQSGERMSAGTVYFPQAGTHLKIDSNGSLISSTDPLLNGHRPSIDVTMRSLAHHYGNAVLGILLTGMGRDGAEGLLAISRVGGITIAQDESSSIVFGMPKAAIELGAAKYILPPEDIAELLMQL